VREVEGTRSVVGRHNKKKGAKESSLWREGGGSAYNGGIDPGQGEESDVALKHSGARGEEQIMNFITSVTRWKKPGARIAAFSEMVRGKESEQRGENRSLRLDLGKEQEIVLVRNRSSRAEFRTRKQGGKLVLLNPPPAV